MKIGNLLAKMKPLLLIIIIVFKTLNITISNVRHKNEI